MQGDFFYLIFRQRRLKYNAIIQRKEYAMKTKWFTEARFGMFIHWGIYAIPAKGEWAYATLPWQPGEYEAFAQKFDPQNYDPAKWARLAKQAGMKYAVLTTRHHDGFCMFDSHFTDYKVTNTPFGKDVVRMYAEAFRNEGLRVGFYHSLPDWTHPGYADMESPEYYQTGKVHTPTAEEYSSFKELLYNHLDQLTTEYGKIDLLFLDYTSKYKADVDYFDRERLLEMVYRNQPEIIVNDRLAYHKDNVRDFDYYTPEICIPNQALEVKNKPVPWETCTTINNNWGFNLADENWKDVNTLTAGLIGCVANNGNLLLNVGPDADGKIPAAAVNVLEELGRWFAVNGEAVTGCGKADFAAPFGCAYTQKDNVIYCFILIPPMGDIILPQLRNRVKKVTRLLNGEEVKQIDFWGTELLKDDELRIRTRGVTAGEVLKIELI